MSIPPVPNEPEPGNQPPAPRYGETNPQFGQPTPPAPQYGQNAPQYGQNAPQPPAYGQQPYGQSPYAQYPSEQPQASGSYGVPQLVNISFWLLIAAGAIFVISMITGINSLNDPQMRGIFEEAMRSGGGAGAGVTYEDMQGVMAGTLVVFAIIGAALYALVAFFIRKGKNWARVLGTVFAALSIFGLFGVPSFATLGTLAGIVAIVLLYLPSAAPYFRSQQPFASPYGNPGNPYGQ